MTIKLDSAQLARLVFVAGPSAKPGPTPAMLAIAGGKGGNGRTMTTLGLTSVFDGPMLAVDAGRDTSNLHMTAGVGRLVDAAFGVPVRESLVRSYPADSIVSVLPAPAGTNDGAFERWFRTAAGDERCVVINCSAGAGPDAAIPLHVADGVVVVSSLCAPAFRDAAKTAAMARALSTPVIGRVISRPRVAPGAVSDFVGAPVLGTVPEESPPVLTRPIIRAAYRRIADKIPGKK